MQTGIILNKIKNLYPKAYNIAIIHIFVNRVSHSCFVTCFVFLLMIKRGLTSSLLIFIVM